MREAGRVAATILDKMVAAVAPGISTYELDQLGARFMEELGATSASYNYKSGKHSYPCYTCISVNEELVHGIGSLKKILKQGDIVSIDVAVFYNGFVGDNARTVVLEPVPANILHLVKTTEEALYVGIAQACPGNKLGDISSAIQQFVEKNKLSVVRDFVGHGVGRDMHEEPQIPNFGKPKTGPILKAGMTLAIEPMVNLGSHKVELLSDGWTVVTADRKPCAHFEHTILITEKKPEILTFLKK